MSVLLGNGDGTFKSAVTYAVGNGPISVAVADFNGDKKLDLVVVNETDNNVSILLGNGDGTFASQVAYPTGVGGNPKDVVVGDFNQTVTADLAVADFTTQQVSVLLGNGDGTFQARKGLSHRGESVFDRHGGFQRRRQNGSGLDQHAAGKRSRESGKPAAGQREMATFGAYSLFSAGYLAYSTVVGDFNGDQALDLAVVTAPATQSACCSTLRAA